MPPSIKVKVVLNKKVELFGIYDSGSNVSLINSRFLKINNQILSYFNNTNLKTINGVKKVNDIIKLDKTIFNIEKKIDVFVIDKEDFDYDFLIGLDCIKKFYLIQNGKLEISQKVPIRRSEIVSKETNKSDIVISKEKKSDNLINFNENFSEKNFKIWINHLDYQEQSVIDDLILENKSVFANDKYDIGMVTDYEAHIGLIIEKYCSKRPYRCTIEDKKEIENQIAKLLEKNIIEESYSRFAAPVTLAYKRDENKTSRLCIDFRDLNKIVVPQSQPFPLIEDLIVKTRDCKFFSNWT